MASLNKVLFIGNLTRDPELRVTPKGTAICSFGFAVNRQFKDESGVTKDEITFLDVEAWGKQGEIIAKYSNKGKALFIEGRLKFDQWDDKTTGQKRSKIKVVLEHFQFLGGRDDAAAGGGSESVSRDEQGDPNGSLHRAAPPLRPPGGSRSAPPQQDNIDEDVPF